MRQFVRRALLVLINIGVGVAILVAIEIGFRLYHATAIFAAASTAEVAKPITFQFWPYVMTGQVAGTHYNVWWDEIRHRMVTVDVATNNAGFPDSEDFDIAKPHAKSENEKIVLFTGGSTAFGVGATSNATITHQKLSKFLNAAQSDVHYKVVNLAMGGWIAQQEAISLDLWGRLFNPDWIITLDGVNDSTVGCAMSQGTGNPVYFQLINTLVTAYLASQSQAVYYRGYWENQLLKYSLAYRSLTGQQYIPPPAHVDKDVTSPLLQVVTPTSLSEVRKQVEFYVLAEQSILERFQDAKFLLTTQPTAQDHAFMLGEYWRDGDSYAINSSEREKFSSELDQWLDSIKPDQVRCSNTLQVVGFSTRYALAMSAVRLAEQVEKYQASRRRNVEYFNTGLLYPKDPEKRHSYFIDNYHLNDAGQETLARFYAYKILQRDFPGRDWSEIRPQIAWFH